MIERLLFNLYFLYYVQLSIIIPHYNSPNLLKRMLNSIPEREDIEIIVVDDCSKSENVKQVRLRIACKAV